MLKAITEKLIRRLNRSNPAARDAELGNRLGAFETIGVIEHDYDDGDDDAVYTVENIPVNSVVVINLANAGDPAGLVLPPELSKMYIVKNASGETVTVKADGETGVAVPNGKTAIIISDGEDFVKVTDDSPAAG